MESYSVEAILSAQDKGFTRGFQQAAKTASSLKPTLSTVSKTMVGAGKKTAVAGAAVSAFAGKAVKSYGDFQDSINQAAVIGGSSNKKLSGNMKGLEKVALSLGKSLPVSADDAAQAMVEMARNGASVGELKKEFPAIAKAAAVSGEDMSSTATTVQQAMNIWGGGAKNAAKDSATLAIVANKSNASIGDMGQVFANVGTTAKNMGYGIKTVGTAAGILTNAGVPAAQASMDLNHAFTQMVKPSKSAAEMMKKLGISYTDQKGNMKPLKQIIQEVAKATDGMAGAQKTAALNTMFGTAGAKAIAPLIDSVGKKAQKSGKGWDAMSDAINKGAGSAGKANKYLSDNSQNMTKNVGQALDQMKDSFDALVKSSISQVGPVIMKVADAFNNFASYLTNAKTPIAQFARVLIAVSPAIGAVLLAVGGLLIGVGKMITFFQKVSQAITLIKTSFTALSALLAANPFVILIAGVAAAVAALVWFFTQTKTGKEMWQSFTTWLTGIWTSIKTTAVTIWNGLAGFFSGLWTGISTAATTAWTTISGYLSTVWNAIKGVASAVWEPIKIYLTGLWTGVKDTIVGVWNGLKTFLSGVWTGISQIASGVWNGIKTLLAGVVLGIYSVVTGNFGLLKKTVVGVWNNMKDAASTIWNGIKSVIGGIAGGISNAVSGAWKGMIAVAKGIFGGIKTAGSNAFNGLKTILITIVSGIGKGLSNAWSGILKAIKGFLGGIKNAFNVIKKINLVNVGKNIIMGLINGLINGAKGIGKTMHNIGKNIINSAKSVLKIHSPSRVFYGIGGYVTEGFINGVSSMDKTVQKSSAALGTMAAGAIGDPINALNNSVSGSYNAHMTLDESSSQASADKIISAIRDGNKIYLDGNKLVGGTRDRIDSAIGRKTKIRGRLS